MGGKNRRHFYQNMFDAGGGLILHKSLYVFFSEQIGRQRVQPTGDNFSLLVVLGWVPFVMCLV